MSNNYTSLNLVFVRAAFISNTLREGDREKKWKEIENNWCNYQIPAICWNGFWMCISEPEQFICLCSPLSGWGVKSSPIRGTLPIKLQKVALSWEAVCARDPALSWMYSWK